MQPLRFAKFIIWIYVISIHSESFFTNGSCGWNKGTSHFYISPGSQQTQDSLFSPQVRRRHPVPVVLCNLKVKDSAFERLVERERMAIQTNIINPVSFIKQQGRFGKNCIILTSYRSIMGWKLHNIYVTVNHLTMGQCRSRFYSVLEYAAFCNVWIPEIHLCLFVHYTQ